MQGDTASRGCDFVAWLALSCVGAGGVAHACFIPPCMLGLAIHAAHTALVVCVHVHVHAVLLSQGG